jgi:hypothetical protein
MKQLNRISITVVFLMVYPLITRSQVITFDDLNPSSLPGKDAFDEAPIPNGYDGLEWNNFWVMDVPQTGVGEGYGNSLVSGDNVAFNGYGNPASISINAGSFDLDSAYLTAALADDTMVEVQGFMGGALTYDNIYTVNTESPTLENFNYFGVDEVIFISTNPTYSGYPIQFAVDNMTINAVPEPTMFSLASLSALCLLLCRRQGRQVS